MQSFAKLARSRSYPIEVSGQVQRDDPRLQETALREATIQVCRVILCFLKAKVAQSAAFLKGPRTKLRLRSQLVGCSTLDSYLHQGAAFFENTNSKVLAPRGKNSSEYITSSKYTILQADYCARQFNYENSFARQPHQWCVCLRLLARAGHLGCAKKPVARLGQCFWTGLEWP